MSHPDIVMPDYQDIQAAILNNADALNELIQSVQTLAGEKGANNGQWQKTLERVQTLLRSETLRVAVIGSVKSGKSTFVNAFLHSDHLKRGAGVITSVVTRIAKVTRQQLASILNPEMISTRKFSHGRSEYHLERMFD